MYFVLRDMYFFKCHMYFLGLINISVFNRLLMIHIALIMYLLTLVMYLMTIHMYNIV